jgi:predicted nucleotidyltransferase component of viral defense system
LAFSELPESEMFYLTGGTALAEFYLAHRKSYDLDFLQLKKTLQTVFRIYSKKLCASFSKSGKQKDI